MKTNYIFALFLGLLLIIATYFVSKQENISQVQVKNTVSKSTYLMNEISESSNKYDIKGYIPVTNIKKLDQSINERYNKIISDFKTQTEDLNLIEDEKKFSLNINFTDYSYNNKYVSFIVQYSCDFGGAHSDNSIFTINYNISDSSFIDIDYLMSKNVDMLNLISKTAYESFKDKEEFKNNLDVLKQGTLPQKQNFQNFVLSENGIIVFFENYSIAPYYLGNFQVLIPYSKLSL